jgi:hypothetical protein
MLHTTLKVSLCENGRKMSAGVECCLGLFGTQVMKNAHFPNSPVPNMGEILRLLLREWRKVSALVFANVIELRLYIK